MTWLFWQVPESRVKHYIVMMLLILFFLPALFGIRYTSMGYVFNVLWADFILFNLYTVQDRIKNNKKDDDADNTF
jgi:hypothetical protein|tara:strand:- start:3329 stop:3553 length:225 start_codon:yes stop_codon:yes gene_type:complete